MTHDPIREAIDLLEEKLRAARNEVAHLEEAVDALNKVGGSQLPLPTTSETKTPSVRVRVLALLDEVEKDWSTFEVIEEFKRRGTPIKATDPSNAVRSALADAKKKGAAISTTTGRYKSARWNHAVAELQDIFDRTRPDGLAVKEVDVGT